MIQIRSESLASLRRAGGLVEQGVSPEGDFDGWNGRDVLCHLAVYARLVGSILRASAENRTATTVELYGRQLTSDELAMHDLDEINAATQRDTAHLSYPEALSFWRTTHAEAEAQLARLSDEQLSTPGPTDPPNWRRPHLHEVVTALTDHYAAHMSATIPPDG